MNSPAYLLLGSEFGEKNEFIEQIKSNLQKKFGTCEQYLYYASETPVNQFMSILQNESLFCDSNFVVVKNAESIKKKDEIEIIVKWINSVNAENSVLVLVSDEYSVDSKLDKAISPGNRKVFWEMYEDKKLPWIYNLFSKNGYKITEDAANLILEMVENNTASLKSECSRFFVCFEKGTQITEEIVEQVLNHSREENAFSLFENMANFKIEQKERFQKSLEILSKIRLSKENSSVMIIAALSSCFRKLVLFHNIYNSGNVDEKVLKMNGFSNAKSKKLYSSATKVWTRGQATGILSVLAETDMNIRSSGTVLENVYLEKIIYEIVMKNGASSAVYE